MNEKKPNEVEKIPETVKYFVDETEFLLKEFKGIKTVKQAKKWIKSIPEGFERLLIFAILLERIKDRV